MLNISKRLFRSLLCGGLLLTVSAPTFAAGSPPKTGTTKPGTTTPAKPAAPAAFTVPAGWPKQVNIPKIGVKAPVEAIALTRPADVHAPYKWGDVAWWDRGAKPGDFGRANVFGHLDSTCCPAVFYKLRNLHTGDVVSVSYPHNKTLYFKVQWQAVYPNSKLPVKFLFGQVHERGLVLWTCTGVFHRDGSGYDHKLIVYARVILPNGQIG